MNLLGISGIGGGFWPSGDLADFLRLPEATKTGKCKMYFKVT
jgi:hypothetical protein